MTTRLPPLLRPRNAPNEMRDCESVTSPPATAPVSGERASVTFPLTLPRKYGDKSNRAFCAEATRFAVVSAGRRRLGSEAVPSRLNVPPPSAVDDCKRAWLPENVRSAPIPVSGDFCSGARKLPALKRSEPLNCGTLTVPLPTSRPSMRPPICAPFGKSELKFDSSTSSAVSAAVIGPLPGRIEDDVTSIGTTPENVALPLARSISP